MADDLSPSGSFIPEEFLDAYFQGSPSLPYSFSGSSVSPMAVDSTEPIMENVANPSLSESATSTEDVLPSNTPPLSVTESETEPPQLMALLPYDSMKLGNNLENEEFDRWSLCNYSSPYYSQWRMYSDTFYDRSEFEYKISGSGWSSWWSSPVSPKKAFSTEIVPTGMGAGLENLGNTCFINAVLQCFTHTVPLVLGLRSLNHHDKPCDRDIGSFCLLCTLGDHIELSLNSSGGVVSPSKIFDNLNYISSCFQKYQQEDAHEFLQCLLDRLESCCSDSKPMDDCLSSSDDCLVKKVFGGRLVSRLCCCKCGHVSYSYEPLNDLSLEIGDVDSLPSALESFTKVEKIGDLEANFRCENCKEVVSVEKQLILDRAPSVAMFHLKRFKTGATFVEKIDKHVVFPLELDMQPYTIVNETSNDELKYQLYAVVIHSGLTPTLGHYVCYIRSSPDTWHELNDSRVTAIKEETVLSQEAYILFYARQGIPWFSTAIEVQNPCGEPGISDYSPTSVLDNTEIACNPQVENSAGCSANESKDAADKILTLPSERQLELEMSEPSVAAETSKPPVNESEFHVSELFDSKNDCLMTDVSLPPGSSNCSVEFEQNISNVEYNCNQGVNEFANGSNFHLMSLSSHCSAKWPGGSSGCGLRARLRYERKGFNRRALNWPVTDQRTEAMRCARRMPIGRGQKFMVLLASQIPGKMKKRAASAPHKRISHRRGHNHNLLHRSVPILR